jgi:hypothetical protein
MRAPPRICSNHLEQIVVFDAVLTQDLSRFAFFFIDDREQQMLGRNKFVLHLVCLLLGGSEDLAQTRTEILLAALHARKARDRRLHVVENDGDVCAELAEYWADNTFRLLEHRDEQMLGLNLLVLVRSASSIAD